MALNWKRVLLDIVIIFVLTMIGGFIVGLIAGASGGTIGVGYLALSNLIFGSAGFAIAAYRMQENRWAHLFAVAVGVWILSIINVVLGFVGISQWILSAIPVLIFMAMGGGAGILLRKMKGTPPSNTTI